MRRGLARRRPRLAPRTLTGRLVLGVVGLVVLIVVLTGGVTYARLRPYLTQRLDQQLAPTADANATAISRCFASGGSSGCTLGNRFGFRSPQKEWIAVLNGDSEIPLSTVGPSTDLAVMQLDHGTITDLQNSTGSPQTITTRDGVELRVAVRPISGDVEVVTGLSTMDVHRTLDRLLLLEVAIGAGAVLLASVVTAVGVRFQLSGLYRVTRTAREVSAELSPEGGGLDRRVPDVPGSSEVTDLTDSVNTMLGAVETQFRARVASEERMRQFLADASHELRTPLTSIRGYAELARMQRASGHDADPETLDRIESEGTRMSRLVDDLLMLARSDQGSTPPTRELLDLAEIADDVASSVRAAHPGRPIEVDVPRGVTTLADPDQLIRVLRNLVTNAAVHTAPGGPIRISGRRGDGWVELQVADSGPGLPPEEAAHVFERFWRADKARTRAKGGSGLGLAIVASIVEAHGGTVRFDSSVDTGSTVTVRLPA